MKPLGLFLILTNFGIKYQLSRQVANNKLRASKKTFYILFHISLYKSSVDKIIYCHKFWCPISTF